MSLARPMTRPLVCQEPFMDATMQGLWNSLPSLGRRDTKQARGWFKPHAQSQDRTRGVFETNIAIKNKGYRTATLSGSDHARTLCLPGHYVCCYFWIINFFDIGDGRCEFFGCQGQCGVQWVGCDDDQWRAQGLCLDAKHFPRSISTATRGPEWEVGVLWPHAPPGSLIVVVTPLQTDIGLIYSPCSPWNVKQLLAWTLWENM